ncbi:unnamed protein product [Arabis nemorensis]|uniref:Neprosin PEP catalytic domain-containing protein n=1 Tax=Arabis nemorensis TaxID=586526 RepID=A0A565CE52_9BRAS|nr:unnamed protein product [Arabis nemorensis]
MINGEKFEYLPEPAFQNIPHVYEWLNKNHTRLYTYWTADGFKKTGCYNRLCPGFVQVNTKFPLGFRLEPVSMIGWEQYEQSIKVYKLKNASMPSEEEKKELERLNMFATVDYTHSTVSRVKGNLNLWDPKVSLDQVSLASMAIAGGPLEQLASILVGWMVHPLLYQGGHIHLYTYWTTSKF